MATTMTQTVDFKADVIDSKNIQSLELADGWHDVSKCQIVQFAVSESHSPLAAPNQLYPALRYENEFGQVVRTPLSKILSFSEDPQQRLQQRQSGNMPQR